MANIDDLTGDTKFMRSADNLSYRLYVPVLASIIMAIYAVVSAHMLWWLGLAAFLLCVGLVWELMKVQIYMYRHSNRPPYWIIAPLMKVMPGPTSPLHRCPKCSAGSVSYVETTDGSGGVQYECLSISCYTYAPAGTEKTKIPVNCGFVTGDMCTHADDDTI